MPLPTRPLGCTGTELPILGLGGEGVLRTRCRYAEAEAVIRWARDLGVRYFESARAYADSESYLGRALGADRGRVLLATKTHARERRAVQAHLEESLRNLRTDHLDLWYAHDLRTADDLERLAAPGGGLAAMAEARRAGRVRLLGVSGHQDPAVLRRALDLFSFDCVLCPVNPAEAGPDGFHETVVSAAADRGLGVIAMKTLFRGLAARVPGVAGPGPFLSYALSVPGVCAASVGCDTPAQVAANVRAVARTGPLSPDERDDLEQRVFPLARRLAFYRRPTPAG